MRFLLSSCTLALCTGLLSGCVDAISSTGQEGLLVYSLYTEYDVPEIELTDARIVTGHEQRLTVHLTTEGRERVASTAIIQHTVLPDVGVTMIEEGGAAGEPPDLRILVSEPGVYTVESRADGEVVDSIDLTFEEPAGIELLAHVRPPWGTEFQPTSGDLIAIEEGSQVTFQAAPLDADGRRLAGDLTTSLTVDPSWAVVPGEGVVETYENGVWTVAGEVSFYFIDPTPVTFTVADPVSGASGEQRFDVAPIAQQ